MMDRIALAAGHKGLPVTWVDHDPADPAERSGLGAVSGQPLAPVAELDDGRVLSDSPAILRALEALVPEPALWPAEPAARARADVLIEWFDACWKPAPNRIAGGSGSAGDATTLRERTARVEGLLADGRPFLLGEAFGIADVTIAPFLRLCGAPPEPGDDPFHRVLAAVPVGPATRAWVARAVGRERLLGRGPAGVLGLLPAGVGGRVAALVGAAGADGEHHDGLLERVGQLPAGSGSTRARSCRPSSSVPSAKSTSRRPERTR